MRGPARAALLLHLLAVCGAATVESVHSRSCEWQYGVNSSDMQCAVQRDRIACYPETNCAGGVFYGLFLQDWLARCPSSPVAEYNRGCGQHLRGPPTARSVVLVIAVSVLSGGVVIAAGVSLALCACRASASDAYAPVGARGCLCCRRPAAPPAPPAPPAAPAMAVYTAANPPPFPPQPQPPPNSMGGGQAAGYGGGCGDGMHGWPGEFAAASTPPPAAWGAGGQAWGYPRLAMAPQWFPFGGAPAPPRWHSGQIV